MKIKLIIWDLDDTLWAGTLADGDEVALYASRVEALRTLNQRGLISAVVSKNDPAVAQAKLEALGLWDDIVFPRISFAPKGAVVRQLIDDMQLRPVNVLFVDDNHMNLEEVKWAVEGINVVDASTPACDALLAEIMAANEGVSRNRVEEYRLLERKTADRAAATGSNEEFLRGCDIHVVVPELTDNIDFSSRLEELANRSNQLNFTTSRFADGELRERITQYFQDSSCWSVFARDCYGSHGLVGFAAVTRHRKIEHFFFSCRVMHMGIEEWLLTKMKVRFPELDTSTLPIDPKPADWITEDRYEGAIRTQILLEESARLAEPQVRFMLDCQSASVAHYAGLIEVAETDLNPRVFKIKSMMDGEALPPEMPHLLVYGAFVEYKNSLAPARKNKSEVGGWNYDRYRGVAERLSSLVEDSCRRLLVIVPPENARKYQPHLGVSYDRVIEFNQIWRDMSSRFPSVTVLDMTRLHTVPSESIDGRHYRIPLLQRTASSVREWFDCVTPADIRE